MPLILPHHGKTPVVPATAYLAPTATVIGDTVLGEHASLWFNVVVRGDVNFIRIGARTNIQDNSTIHVTPGTQVPPRSLVLGRPGRVARRVTDGEVEDLILKGVANYLRDKETCPAG